MIQSWAVGKRYATLVVSFGAGEWVSGSKSQWISSTVQRGTESPNLQILFNSNRGFYDFLPVCSAHPRRRRVLWGASGRWSVYSISISFIALSLFRKGYIFFLWGICFLKIITGGCLSISLPNPSQVRISDNEQARQQRRRRNRKNNNVDVTSRQHWWRGIIPWMDMVAGGLVVVEEDGYCLQALKAAAVRRRWMEGRVRYIWINRICCRGRWLDATYNLPCGFKTML